MCRQRQDIEHTCYQLNQEGLQNKQIYLLGFKNAFLLVEDRKCYAIFYAKLLKDFHLP